MKCHIYRRGNINFTAAEPTEYTLLVQVATVELPNKGHIGDIHSAVLSFIERLSSFRGSQCIKTIGNVIFGTLSSVLCREVYYTVSLFCTLQA